ncbi:excinuclease ABC subunit UvrA [Botrimarina colliarenosi]|uniref:excinuclease ABC subunit UvrA n=1 Tax=Botrimarina colliarenosi TaxID=2528001 RepID=UPI001E499C05|nr:excinuclease ABC subunit UvrA [Botrimarina colliarenosi]
MILSASDAATPVIDALKDDTPKTSVAGSRTNGELSGGAIRIRGARVHNLRNIDVDLPRNQLVVITGVSGSGKSSLAFDTLLAEGQRQYVDSLSVYARQFFQQRARPDVDRIEGLQPAVAIDQSQGSHSPRSTVGTITEVHDYLRLLYARAGEMACPECGEAITQQTPGEIEQAVASLPVDSRAMLLAPLVRGRKGKHSDVVETARKAGFVRLRIDGLTYPIEDLPELTAQKLHDIEAVVDRVVLREGIETRLAESVRLAIKHGDGVVRVVFQTPEAKAAATSNGDGANGAAAYNAESGWEERLFNTRYACPTCKVGVAEVEPRTFSFNSPYGACPECDGMGVVEAFDPDLVLPDLSRSLVGGAVAPWRTASDAGKKKRLAVVAPLLAALKVTDDTPLADWPRGGVQKLLTGDGKEFPGLLLLLEQERLATTREASRDRLDAFRDAIVCPDCEGTRLRPEGRACRIAGKRIFDVGAMPIADSAPWFAGLLAAGEFDDDRLPIAEPLVREIHRRLEFLEKAGVGYLTLDRSAHTLSGGELQRVRLATGVGSGLVGVMYLLDEPSIGLHPRDNDRLLEAIRDLRRQGNTVIVVEHDEAVIRAADWVIDIGPGAGARGGYLVAEGTPDQIAACPESVTGRYLSGAERIATPTQRRITTKSNGKAVAACPAPMLALRGATLHNLRGDDFELPLGKLVCVAGVSGSGKTSLVVGTLARALARQLNGAGAKPGPHTALEGLEHLDRFVAIDQSPIGRSPRSNAATYTGAFDEVRKLLAKTKLSRQRGYKPSRFSFNVKGGRCEECQGQGQRKIEMNFLPDLYVTCDACRGARFNRATLAVRYKGLTVADMLSRPIEEVLPLFVDAPSIDAPLEALAAVGLGYLSLGQPANTLSGGEAQRVKLAAELGGAGKGGVPARTLYLLDEPTTGLHADDVRRLLGVLGRLVDAGATVLVIEHHLDVMRQADWIVDLGPDGGAGGGRIVAAGTPEHVAAKGPGPTSEWLRRALEA